MPVGCQQLETTGYTAFVGALRGLRITAEDHNFMTSPDDVVQFAQITRRLLAQQDTAAALQAVVDLAVDTIDACDFAGVTMRHKDHHVDTPAMTDPVVGEADSLQYELREGPCLDALYVDDMYLIEDIATENRWPRWAPAAAELGLRSSLSVRLQTDSRLVGGLNMYSTRPRAFGQDDVMTAHIYALHASDAILQAQDKDGLRIALNTRHTIGVAQGLLMASLDIDQDRAFQVMRRVSQHNNIKLRALAEEIVARRGRLQDLPMLRRSEG